MRRRRKHRGRYASYVLDVRAAAWLAHRLWRPLMGERSRGRGRRRRHHRRFIPSR